MVKDNGDGTKTVKYTPEDCGPYEISVTYGGEPVPGAPFKTTAIPTGDASKCKLTGKGRVYMCCSGFMKFDKQNTIVNKKNEGIQRRCRKKGEICN